MQPCLNKLKITISKLRRQWESKYLISKTYNIEKIENICWSL